MQKLADILTALRQYIKQYHWLARGYDNHLLADRLENEMGESLDASIDRIKELALAAGEGEQIAYADNSLTGALEILKGIPTPTDTKTETVLNNIGMLIFDYMKESEDYSKRLQGQVFKGAIDNAIFGIGEDMMRRAYLLNIQMQGLVK